MESDLTVDKTVKLFNGLLHNYNFFSEGGARRRRPPNAKPAVEFAYGLRCNDTKFEFVHSVSYQMRILRRETMKVKINEDWLATILAFVLLFLALINIVQPSWVKF